MSGQWTPTNPGLGSPPEIRGEAGRRRSHAEQLQQSQGLVGAASAEAAAGWQSQAGSTLVSVAAGAQSELSGLSSQISAVADALSRYANDVDTVQQQQRAIETRQDDTTTALTRARRTLEGLKSKKDTDPSDIYRTQGHIEALNWQMRGFSGQLAALASQRSAADNAAILTLTGTGTRGALAGILPDRDGGVSRAVTPTVTLQQLSALSATELAALFALYPDLAEQLLADEDPNAVAQWWASLSTGTQTALVFGASALIGSLGGVSAVARAAANRLNAAKRLDEIDARVAELRGTPTSGGFSTPAYGYDAGTFDAEISRLLAERGYLQKAVEGTVQLYLYDPSTRSIIEMIGTPGPQTTAINTYVPGTFTSAFSFYGGGVQQVGTWLQSTDPSQVTFVWKQGLFPGEDPETGDVQILPRIIEANFSFWADYTGSHLADFQAEMRAATTSSVGASHNAIGYSWGLAAVTSSESPQTHYDHVVSLSGAGMPSGWEPQHGTVYSHYAYRDALTMAQQSGQVWSGNNPGTSSAYEQHHYATPEDVNVVIPPILNPFAGEGAKVVVPLTVVQATTDPLGNHELIASNDVRNWSALGDVLKGLRQ